MKRMRLLVALPDHPHPPNMGSRVRNLGILEALARSFDLTILTLVHDPGHLAEPGPVARFGRWVPVLAEHRRGRVSWAAWHVRSRVAATREGLHAETFFQSLPAYARAVGEIVREERPALVHAAYWYGLRRHPAFARPPLWVVDTHDVQFERHERLLHRRSPRERGAELRELSRYDRIVAITERDAATFRSNLGAAAPPVEVIGMGLDFARWDRAAIAPGLPDAPRVAFYGNLSTEANAAAARHLLRDLRPAWEREVPGLELLLLGADPSGDLHREAAAAGALVPGYVDDPRPWLASVRVLALALRSGSGQRGRVVEALALGVPVVGYREALEGLDLSGGEGIVIVDDVEQMERRTAELLNDPGQARRIGAAGRAAAEARYGWEATYGRFPALYQRMLSA